MIELILQSDATDPSPSTAPRSAAEAQARLTQAQAQVAALLNTPAGEDARLTLPLTTGGLALGDAAGAAPAQMPFAAVLGCADARMPPELVFGQGINDLFVVRVAGNGPGGECVGSLDFAVHNLADLRLLVVLGHTSCGAVTAAADAFLHPSGYLGLADNLPLRGIVDSLMAAVVAAAAALEAAYGSEATALPGYRAALIELAVILNAAITAAALRRTFAASIGEALDVVYAVYNLHNHVAGLPGDSASNTAPDGGWAAGLASPPADAAALAELARRMACSGFIERLLRGAA